MRLLKLHHLHFVLAVFLSGTLFTLASPILANRHFHDDDHSAYKVTLTSSPEQPIAGQPFALTLKVVNTQDETPLTGFEEVHTKLLHLILVSEDLNQFLHLHPDYVGEGEFVLNDVTLPQAGNYVIFSDFTPTEEDQQVIRSTLSTKSAAISMPHLAVSEPDVVVGPLNIHLELPADLSAGITQDISFHVTDSQSGDAIDTLDEYLGAAGHLVIIDPTAETYIHTHPAGDHVMSGMSGMTMQYGPELSFAAEFPSTGLWAAWLQIQYQDEVYTAPFVFEVSGEDSPQPEATHDAHAHG